jgi:hypothetical protein
MYGGAAGLPVAFTEFAKTDRDDRESGFIGHRE